MAVTTEEPQTDDAQPLQEAPARACSTCGAALSAEQDWCLECGAAQPGRLGGRAGWRAALTVLALTGVLVGGAGAAAYAALSTEAQREARAPAPPAAVPTVAQAPETTLPEASPSGEGEDLPEVDAPKSDPADVPQPSGDDTPADTPTSNAGAGVSGSAGTGSGSTGSTGSSTGDAEPEPVAVDLPAEAAETYDPYDRGANDVGDPGDAIDGDDKTAWEAPVAEDGTVNIGLLVSLDKAQILSDLEMKADTPGFTVEVYATKGPELPPDVLDARWEHIDNQRDVDVTETFALDGRYRHVLLWITEQPADTKVAIPEIKLYE